MHCVWKLLLVVLLVGCGEEAAEDVEAGGSEEMVIQEPAWRWFADGDEDALRAEEALILRAVRRLVEERREPNWRPVDYVYEIERRDDGHYQVFLRHLVAYRDGEGVQTPGGHALYVVDAEGSLVDFIPGR